MKSTIKKNVQPVKKEVKAVVEKTTAKVQKVEKESSKMKDILSKIEQMELTKKYYGKIKVKQNNLDDALADMEKLKTKYKAHFESDKNQEDFPYEVILIKNGKYNKNEEIFKINKPETVTNFTRYLFSEVSKLILLFESELREYYEQMNK